MKSGWSCAVIVATGAFLASPVMAQDQLLAEAESVEVTSGADGVPLAGSFRAPAAQVLSAVVLLGVSGPNDRDLSLGALKPFTAWAEHLRGAGVAVLTLDDRGVGSSRGHWSRADHETLVDDALSALRWLAARTGLPAARLGLIGLSEGSAIAMRAAARAPGAAGFLVLGSPPGLPGRKALQEQLEGGLRAAGVTGDRADRYRESFSRFLELSRAAAADTAVLVELTRFLAGPGGALVPPYRFVPPGARERAMLFSSPWYRSQVEYDPAAFLSRVTAPVLIVGGGLDPVLPPERHHPPLVAGLGSADVRAEVVPGVNHLLLPAATGSPTEYARIREAADPRVLALVIGWLAERGLAARP